jgi:hypothetical protein
MTATATLASEPIALRRSGAMSDDGSAQAKGVT